MTPTPTLFMTMLAISTRQTSSFTPPTTSLSSWQTTFITHRHLSTNQQRIKPRHAIHSSHRILPLNRPPDPSTFQNNTSTEQSNNNYIQSQSTLLHNWLQSKQNILVVTGAGISTESGIPDYRGSNGSYFKGHKPIIHHEYMTSVSSRKRYWARSLVGYSPFRSARPNEGHVALAKLEEMGVIGVNLDGVVGEDVWGGVGVSCFGYSSSPSALSDENDNNSTDDMNGNQTSKRLSIITQNVDILHSKGGARHVMHLHGRGDIVRCMNCGVTRDRTEYHDHLLEYNKEWIEANSSTSSLSSDEESEQDAGKNNKETNKKASLRPDGDADWYLESYDGMTLPPCPHCGTTHDNNDNDKSHEPNNDEQQEEEQSQSFYKTDVVFFGDSVPRHRFDIAYAAVDKADGILCIGTSLAVHSAYRLAKRALEKGTEVAILNVGETRLESEGLDESTGLVTKIESPIGETLVELVKSYGGEV